MTYSACGNEYTNYADSGWMEENQWWDIPGTKYSLKQTTTTCDCTEASVCPNCNAYYQIYVDSRSTYLSGGSWCTAFYGESHDAGYLCIEGIGFDNTYYPCLANWRANFGFVCSTYSDVYVDTVDGYDGYCGDSSSYPVKTFEKAYINVSSGGTIHVQNDDADFSGESGFSLNKSFYITTAIDGRYFFMPQTT